MNFLGHLLVSGDDPLVITGNFMADAVKGRDYSHYGPGIEKGIRMHRAIDQFTDGHPITQLGRDRLRAHCGKYAGVALDMAYDHVLAAHWEEWHPDPLPQFAQRMYATLAEHAALMPERTRRMLPYMTQGDWLTGYARIEGLASALSGLSRRVPGGEVLEGAERVVQEHADVLHVEFNHFLRELMDHLKPFRE